MVRFRTGGKITKKKGALANGRLVDGGGSLGESFHTLGHRLGRSADGVCRRKERRVNIWRSGRRFHVRQTFTCHVEVLGRDLRRHQRSRYEVLVHRLTNAERAG